jgi:hypothetical protein
MFGVKVMEIEEGCVEDEAEMSLSIATSTAGGGHHSRDTNILFLSWVPTEGTN